MKNGIAIDGATSSSHTTPPTTAADDGSLFSVLVSNIAGSVTSKSKSLVVIIAPAITTQPIDRTVSAGKDGQVFSHGHRNYAIDLPVEEERSEHLRSHEILLYYAPHS